jgi:hypothetical protein
MARLFSAELGVAVGIACRSILATVAVLRCRCGTYFLGEEVYYVPMQVGEIIRDRFP